MVHTIHIYNLIILHITNAGSAQIANLTRITQPLTCPEEIALFTCTVSTSRVQWIAQPFFTSPVSFSNDGNVNSDPISEINDFGPSGGIIIRRVGDDPLLTVMVVQGNLINESFDVTCTPLSGGVLMTNDTEIEEYIPGEYN